MSNNESFIDEVTEEVRRDRLFQYLRRYGWIAVLVVLGLVGVTAYSEYRKAQAQAQAEATGDAIMAALEVEDETARAAALTDLDVSGGAAAVTRLLAAADLEAAGDSAGAAATLDAVAADPDTPALYRDLASLKSLMLLGDSLDADTRRAALSALAQPGAPFRMLALEQLALVEVEAGQTDAAIEQYRAIAEAAEVTQGLRDRALAMIVALGGEVGDLVDPTARGTTGQAETQ